MRGAHNIIIRTDVLLALNALCIPVLLSDSYIIINTAVMNVPGVITTHSKAVFKRVNAYDTFTSYRYNMIYLVVQHDINETSQQWTLIEQKINY